MTQEKKLVFDGCDGTAYCRGLLWSDVLALFLHTLSITSGITSKFTKTSSYLRFFHYPVIKKKSHTLGVAVCCSIRKIIDEDEQNETEITTRKEFGEYL